MSSLIKKIDSNHQLSWKRPLDQRVKSNLSKKMQSILGSRMDNSAKSKIYNQTLSRFRHIGTKVPRDEDVEEEEEEPARPQKVQKKRRSKKGHANTTKFY